MIPPLGRPREWWRALGPAPALVAVAASAWVGAVHARPVSLLWPVGMGTALVVVRGWRRPRVLFSCLLAASCLVTSALAADAWRGLAEPIPPTIEERVQLVGDPRPLRHGVRVEARAGGKRWHLVASGSAAGVLGGLRAGETVVVQARTTARQPDDRWRASRHIVGTAVVDHADGAGVARGPWRLANAVHRALLRSTSHLPPDVRGVALGIALGDRGGMGDLLAEDLRAAGLSHLTAVSGQHVALLIAMAAPLLGRLSTRHATVVTAILLAGFVVLTRGEPSVLRAAAMAMVVALLRARGRRTHAVGVLAVVVATLVVVDPLLVWSVGFQLSVVATAGIALGASTLASRLPGPRPVANALGVSLAAQVTVAPLVIIHFGVMPVVGVLANLAVVPVIGVLMGWTLLAGMVGGAVPASAGVLHVPTHLLGGWVVGVAQWAATLGVPGVGRSSLGPLVISGVGLGVGLVLAGRGRRLVARVVVVVAAMGMLVGVVGAGGAAPAPGRSSLGVGAELVVGGEALAVILDGRASPGVVAGALRQRGVRRIDTLVVRTDSASSWRVVHAIRSRFGVGQILVPAGSTSAGVVGVGERHGLLLGGFGVEISPGGDGRLEVRVTDPV